MKVHPSNFYLIMCQLENDCLHFAEWSGMELDWVGFGLVDIALKRLDGMAMDWIACLKELKQLELCTKWTIH